MTSPEVLHLAVGFPAQERHGPLGEGPEDDHKMVSGVEHLSCEERLRKLGLIVKLWEEKAVGDLIAAFERGIMRKVERDFLPRPLVTGQGIIVLN